MFNSAVIDYGIIKETPMLRIKTFAKKTTKEKRALSLEEIETIFANVTSKELELILFIGIYAGLRIGEVCGLTWNNIDFENSVINVNQQWVKDDDNSPWKFGALKSKNSKRSIPIPKILLDKFANYDNTKGYDNNCIFEYKNVQLASNLACDYLRQYGIVYHELRHTFGTMLVEKFPITLAAKLLGHTPEETLRTYAHVTADMEAKYVKEMNDLYNFNNEPNKK
jgi:integrase